MRFIQNLTFETENLLRRLYKQSQHHRVRQRAHCILLSSQGRTINHLTAIFDVSRLTIYHWFNTWEKRRFAGLYDQKGRGRPMKLTPEEQDNVLGYITQYPQDMKKVAQIVEQETTKKVSTKTLKRLIKKNAISGNVLGNLQRNVLTHRSMSKENSSLRICKSVRTEESVLCGILMYLGFA